MSDSKFKEILIKGILERKEILPGGLGDNAPDSEFDSKQLEMGIKAELEHTKNKSLAKEIAKDHLKEDPKYYTKLKKMESKSLTEKSHWAKRKSENGKKTVKQEYSTHKKRRNETGAAREQNRRVRNTERGKAQANARDEIRRKKEQGKLTEPKTCPICGKNPGKTKNGLSNMIWDHDKGYSEEGEAKGRWMCRTCHNKKDNNKPGDTSVKNKRRTDGLGSIDKEKGEKYIKKASQAESKASPGLIKLIADHMFTIY